MRHEPGVAKCSTTVTDKPNDAVGKQKPLYAWTTLVILLTFYVFGMLDRQVIAMVVDPIRDDLDISDLQMGNLMGFSFALFYAVCALPMGWLVDTKPRRVVLFWGVALWSVATSLSGLAKSYLQLFTARMFVGIGEATLMPAAYSLLSDAFPRKRLSIAMALFSLGAYFGSALAILLGGAIADTSVTTEVVALPVLGEVKAWQLVFLIAGGPCLLLSATIFLVPEPPRRGVGTGPMTDRPGWLDVVRFIQHRPRLWLNYVTIFSMMSIMPNSLIMWQPTHISRYHGWTPGDFGPILALVVVVPAMAGKLLVGFVCDFFWSRGVKDIHFRYYLFVMPLAILFTITALLSSQIWLFFAFICFFFAFISPFQAIGAASVQMVSPNRLRGKLSSLILLITNILGLGLGPAIVPYVARYVLADETNIGAALAVLIGLCGAIALATMYFGLRPLREAMADAEQWQ